MSTKKIKALVSEGTIVLTYDGKSINVQKKDSPEMYVKLNGLIKDKKEDEIIKTFIDLNSRIGEFSSGLLEMKNSKAFLKGSKVEIPKLIADKLMSLEKSGESFMPLLRFWKKLSSNPSAHSREQLYGFMVANKIAITEQGDLVVEKGVRQKHGSYPGHLVDGHSGTVDNSVGMVVEMPRDRVNPNPTQTCSHGLHVAAPDYVRNHYGSDVIVECIVNPADVVAVPNDYKNTKMRCCRYQVVGYADKSPRKADQVVKLDQFVTEPTEIAEKAMNNRTKEPSTSGEHNETVKSTPRSKVISTESRAVSMIEGKTAKEIIELVKQETGELIEINVKNKTAIIKKAVELIDLHLSKRESDVEIKQIEEDLSGDQSKQVDEKFDYNFDKTVSGELPEITPEINDEEVREQFPANVEGSDEFNTANEQSTTQIEDVVEQQEPILEQRETIDLATYDKGELKKLAKARFNESFGFFDGENTVRKTVTKLLECVGVIVINGKY